MSTFVFSVIAGFLMHQLITMIQPAIDRGPRRFQKFRLGPRVVIRLPARTYLRVKAYAIAAMISLFVLLLIFIVGQATHPPRGYAYRLTDAITSSLIGSAFFGLLVGFLVGNLMNRLFRAEKYELGSRDRLEVFLIVALFVLGIGGEELLRSSARRISKISIGATNEISFADSSVKSARSSTEQPGNAGEKAGARGEYLSTGGSNGLPKLRNLGADVEQDREYIRLIYRYEKAVNFRTAEWVQEPKTEIERLIQTTISPIGSCLDGIYAKTADAAFVEEIVLELSKSLRDLTSSQEKDEPRVTEKVVKRLSDTVDSVQINAREILKTILFHPVLPEPKVNQQFLKYCRPLAMLACDDDWKPGKNPSSWTSEPAGNVKLEPWLTSICDEKGGAESEAAKEKRVAESDADKAKRVAAARTAKEKRIARIDTRIRSAIETPAKKDPDQDTPYTAIAFASVMAHLSYHEAAALVLDEWIESHKSANNDIRMKWLVLRARFALGDFVEEWIRSSGDASGLKLREYHVDNLKSIVSELSELSAVADLERLNSKYELKVDFLGASQSGDEGFCNLPDKLAGFLDGLEKEGPVRVQEAGKAKSGTEAAKDKSVPPGGDADKSKPASSDNTPTAEVDWRAKPGSDILSALFESYVSAQSTYVDNFLKHALLKVKGATIVDGQMRKLAKLDLKCVPGNRLALRAEILERYARNETNLIENLSLFGNKDKIAERILSAQRVLVLAMQLLDRDQRNERVSKDADSFLKRVTSSPNIELYETLLTLQGRLQDLAEKNAAQ
jgi:hypothetical protein